MKNFFHLVLFVTLLISCSSKGYCALVTFEFEAFFTESFDLANAGDRFFGSYTFDNTIDPVSYPPGSSLTIQTNDLRRFPTTKWNSTIVSTVIPTFSVTGNSINIAVGNDTTIFGDRYSITLTGDSSTLLPNGKRVNFIQFDLQSPYAFGANLIDEDAFDILPDLSKQRTDTSNNGRFFVIDGDSCEQCRVKLTSLTRASAPGVPEPATMALMGLGLAGAGFVRRKKK